MAHLKSKFFKSFIPSQDWMDMHQQTIKEQQEQTIKIDPDSLEEGFHYSNGFFITDNEVVQAITFKDKNGKQHAFVEFNPAVSYCDGGLQFVDKVEKNRTELLSVENITDQNVYTSRHRAHKFFLTASTCCYNLISGAECFINDSIENFTGTLMENPQNPLSKPADIDNDVLRNWSFIKKTERLLPQIYGKDFSADTTKSVYYDTLKELIELRRQFTHLKKIKDQHSYRGTMVRALQFDYTTAYTAVAEFINYYTPGLIEICNCGKPE